MTLLARGMRSVALLACLIAALIAASGGAWWGAASFAGMAIGSAVIAAWAKAHTGQSAAVQLCDAAQPEPEDAKPGGRP